MARAKKPQPNLLIAFPLYHNLPAKFFTHYLGMDQSMVAGHIFSECAYINVAMDLIVERALAAEADWDRLVIFEHDMLVPHDAFNRIAAYSPERHIVGSIYFQHNPPFLANVLGAKSLEEPEALLPFHPEVIKKIVAEPALYECHAVGMGLTSIHRDVLEKWDPAVPMWQMHPDSHDIYFCRAARAQGWNVYVDSAICCDHLTEAPVGLGHNQTVYQMMLEADGEGKVQDVLRGMEKTKLVPAE